MTSAESRPRGRPGLLRRRPYLRRVWLSEIVSLLGDWMSLVAVSLLALGDGSGVVALALVMVGHHLPIALFAPVAGVLADRLDRRWLLVVTSGVQGVLTLGMAGAVVLGSVAAVQVLVFVRASVGALRFPVQSAVLRHVVEEDELLEANAILSATWSVMLAVGMAAGGAIAALGPTTALVLDAASFGLGALLLGGLPPMVAEGRPAEGGVARALVSVRRDLGLAWRHAWERPPLLAAVLAKTPVHLANGGALILLNVVAAQRAFAGTAALTLGLLQCVRGAGTGIGPLVGMALVRRGVRGEVAAAAAAWTAFGGIAALALTRHWAALLAVAFVWGLGSGANWVLSSSELQRLSPDRFVGRLSAVDNLALTLGLCATMLGGAVVAERIEAPASAAWIGLGAGVLAWIGVEWMLRRRAAATGAAELGATGLASPREAEEAGASVAPETELSLPPETERR
ncbi:MFS transporter [Sorangium cellulosum]|uniref:MFS transporter n=1 Tax=Sorangium cellulosum TaxID=56 RepID=A0A2L0F5I9_SORCE|nr:MFS transporter [Sorangium cellulosum]AUX46802.1 MFS transporter [Sorangium cellulosum]